MAQLYRVILTGSTLSGRSVEEAAAGLARLVDRTPAFAAGLLRGRATTVKTGVDLATASRHAAALEAVGVEVRVEPEQVELLDIPSPSAVAPAPPPRVAAPAPNPATVAPPADNSPPAPQPQPKSAWRDWRLWLGLAGGAIVGRLFGLVGTIAFFVAWWLVGRSYASALGPDRRPSIPQVVGQAIIASLTAIAASWLFLFVLTKPASPEASTPPPTVASTATAPKGKPSAAAATGTPKPEATADAMRRVRDDEVWSASALDQFDSANDIQWAAIGRDLRFASPAVWNAVQAWQRVNMSPSWRALEAPSVALYAGVNDVLHGFTTCAGGLRTPGRITIVDARHATDTYPTGTPLMEMVCRQLIYDPFSKTYELGPQ